MTQMTLLQIVSDASMEIGLTQIPLQQALGSADEDVTQMAALVNAVADDLLLDEPYEETLGDGFWVQAAEGGDVYRRPVQDTDIVLFDGRTVINGLKYRFLQAKGLEYGEALRDFAGRINKIAARANYRVLDLDAEESIVQ